MGINIYMLLGGMSITAVGSVGVGLFLMGTGAIGMGLYAYEMRQRNQLLERDLDAISQYCEHLSRLDTETWLRLIDLNREQFLDDPVKFFETNMRSNKFYRDEDI